jgi:pyroglutamyl-peptidase
VLNVKILLTGFEPFGGESINPALESVKRLHRQTIAGAEVISLELPVTWDGAMPKVAAAIAELSPDVVISVGQAGSRAKVTPEYIGINVMNGKDNAGAEKRDQRIDPNGPDGHFSTLPVLQMVAAMQAADIPAAVSYTAGTYLCNFLAYSVPHYIAANNLPIKAGFIHIPYLPQQVHNKPAGTPSLPLETIVAGLRECIKAIAEQA